MRRTGANIACLPVLRVRFMSPIGVFTEIATVKPVLIANRDTTEQPPALQCPPRKHKLEAVCISWPHYRVFRFNLGLNMDTFRFLV